MLPAIAGACADGGIPPPEHVHYRLIRTACKTRKVPPEWSAVAARCKSPGQALTVHDGWSIVQANQFSQIATVERL